MTKSKPTLENLLNKCDEDVSISDEYKEWDQMQPFGKEFGSDGDQNRKNEETEDIEVISISEERNPYPK